MPYLFTVFVPEMKNCTVIIISMCDDHNLPIIDLYLSSYQLSIIVPIAYKTTSDSTVRSVTLKSLSLSLWQATQALQPSKIASLMAIKLNSEECCYNSPLSPELLSKCKKATVTSLHH